MAKKPRKKYTPFAVTPDGQKFVDSAAIMSPLVAFVDGLPITTFRGDRRVYLGLAVAIGWVEREMEHHSREKYEQILRVLYRFRDQGVAPADSEA